MPKAHPHSQCFAYRAQNASFCAKLPGTICVYSDHRGQVWSGQCSQERTYSREKLTVLNGRRGFKEQKRPVSG